VEAGNQEMVAGIGDVDIGNKKKQAGNINSGLLFN
jgi:hypothetical protein